MTNPAALILGGEAEFKANKAGGPMKTVQKINMRTIKAK